MTTACRMRFGRLLVLGGVLLPVLGLAACGIVDPDERLRAHERPGILERWDGVQVLVPEGASVGEVVRVSVTTHSYLDGGFMVGGPHRTVMEVTGTEVEISPFDLASPVPEDGAALLIDQEFEHAAAFVPSRPGTYTVRVLGERFASGPGSKREPLTVERTVMVEP